MEQARTRERERLERRAVRLRMESTERPAREAEVDRAHDLGRPERGREKGAAAQLDARGVRVGRGGEAELVEQPDDAAAGVRGVGVRVGAGARDLVGHEVVTPAFACGERVSAGIGAGPSDLVGENRGEACVLADRGVSRGRRDGLVERPRPAPARRPCGRTHGIAGVRESLEVLAHCVRVLSELVGDRGDGGRDGADDEELEHLAAGARECRGRGGARDGCGRTVAGARGYFHGAKCTILQGRRTGPRSHHDRR